MTTHRVVDELNGALHRLLESDENTYLLGEDLLDPYGGAFGVSRGLSTRFPRQVISTPISEQAVMGVAGGLALCGDRVVVEVMFGDFITLSYDPLVNFITKSVGMYGRRVSMPVVVRCPVGGGRGYGATHSQNVQKLLLGVPHLTLHELSPFHDPHRVLLEALEAGRPTVLFEDKVLYTRPWQLSGDLPEFFEAQSVDDGADWMEVGVPDDAPVDVVVIAAGGTTPRVVQAMAVALLDHEVNSRLLVPSRLDPLDLGQVLTSISAAPRVLVVDDGVAGASWGEVVAHAVHTALWGRLVRPVRVVQPERAVIPAAASLERELLVGVDDVVSALLEVSRA